MLLNRWSIACLLTFHTASGAVIQGSSEPLFLNFSIPLSPTPTSSHASQISSLPLISISSFSSLTNEPSPSSTISTGLSSWSPSSVGFPSWPFVSTKTSIESLASTVPASWPAISQIAPISTASTGPSSVISIPIPSHAFLAPTTISYHAKSQTHAPHFALPSTRSTVSTQISSKSIKSVESAVHVLESALLAYATPAPNLAIVSDLLLAPVTSIFHHRPFPFNHPQSIAAHSSGTTSGRLSFLALNNQGDLIVPLPTETHASPVSSISGIQITPISQLSASAKHGDHVLVVPTTSGPSQAPITAAAAIPTGKDDSDGANNIILGGDNTIASEPKQPLPLATQTAAPVPPIAGLSKSQQIGVGVGVAVPGAALVVVAAVFFAARKSRRNTAGYRNTDDPSEKDDFLAKGPNGSRQVSASSFSNLLSKDNTITRGEPLESTRTAYNSGSFAISSPVPGSFRKNVVLPSPALGTRKSHSLILSEAVDEEADLNRHSLVDRHTSPLQARALSILSGLGLVLNRPTSLRQDEEFAIGDQSTRIYPEIAYLYDPPVRGKVPIPQPPPFTPRQSQTALVSPVSPMSYRHSGATPSPVDETIIAAAVPMPPPRGRTVPHLRVNTALRVHHSWTAPPPQRLSPILDTEPRLGDVSRGSVIHKRVASQVSDAAEMTSMGGSLLSSRDGTEVLARTDSTALRSSGVLSPGVWAEDGDPYATDAAENDVAQRAPNQVRPPSVAPSLRRSKAIRRSLIGSVSNKAPSSTNYSPIEERDSPTKWTETGEQSPLMSPEELDQHVADFRELARGRSVRSCTP